MYWNIPIEVKGNLVTAAAKQSNGNDVTNPPSMSSRSIRKCSPNASVPWCQDHRRNAIPKGATSIVSIARPPMGCRLRFFRNNPYRPKLNAKASASQGMELNNKTWRTIPNVAIPMANHCNGRSRSLRNKTPSPALTSGLIK